jgi:hypothetical protein
LEFGYIGMAVEIATFKIGTDRTDRRSIKTFTTAQDLREVLLSLAAATLCDVAPAPKEYRQCRPAAFAKAIRK